MELGNYNDSIETNIDKTSTANSGKNSKEKVK